MESRYNHIDITNEKIHKIINAAFEVFSKNDLEKASTNQIVKLAGISRGLLYHYFKDKQELFDFLVFFSVKVTFTDLEEKIDWDARDFLNRMRQSIIIRFDIMTHYPYSFQFFRKYGDRSTLADIRSQFEELDTGLREKIYTHNIDFSQVKAGTDPDKMINVIRWTLKGIMREHLDEIQANKETPGLKKVLSKCDEYIEFLRKQFYQ